MTSVEQTAGDLGLVHIVDFPFMVRDGVAIEPEGKRTPSSWGARTGPAMRKPT